MVIGVTVHYVVVSDHFLVDHNGVLREGKYWRHYADNRTDELDECNGD
jgi:hypothetical protein